MPLEGFPAYRSLLPSNAAVVLRKKNRAEDGVGGQVASPQRTGNSPRIGNPVKPCRLIVSSSRRLLALSPLNSGVCMSTTGPSTPPSHFAERAKYHCRHTG